MSEASSSRALVILGFDAGDPKWMQQWATEGRLPTVAGVMKNGCWGQTAGPQLLLEHGVWQTILSGMSRAQTGHYYFRQLKSRSYDLQLVTGKDIDPRPFWSCFKKNHGRTLIADVPDILPSPAVNGPQIANWAVHRGWHPHHPAEQPMTHPPELLRQLVKVVAPPQLIVENAQATTEQDQQMYRQLLARVAQKGALCRAMIGDQKPNVAVIVFGESHSAGHQFWKYAKVASGPNGGSVELENATRSIYEAIDREMASLLGEFPSDSDVVILSSVGLTDHYPTGRLLESFCIQLGYQVPRNGGPASPSPMTLLRKSIPERWRIALSRNFSRETRERLLAEQFRSATDWSRTTAFVIPSIYTGFIQINLRGREPSGIVEPGEQYESILDQIENDLTALIDPVTGKPAIEKVIRTAHVFGQDAPSVMPDLVVHWQPCPHLLERVVHPRCELAQTRPDFNRASDHYEHGFFAAAGPSIEKRGRLPDIDPMDLAPTFLRLLGEPQPAWMSGLPVGALLRI